MSVGSDQIGLACRPTPSPTRPLSPLSAQVTVVPKAKPKLDGAVIGALGAALLADFTREEVAAIAAQALAEDGLCVADRVHVHVHVPRRPSLRTGCAWPTTCMCMCMCRAGPR